MPSLKDLSTNLKNFTYYSGRGNFTGDKVGYGGNKPLITTPPGFRWSPSNVDDGFMQFGTVTAATRSAYDTARITKFLLGSIKGPLFVLKQTALQRTNVALEYSGENTRKSEISSGKVRNLLNKLSNDFGPTRQYTPWPMLAQVATNAFGAKLMRHGRVPAESNSTSYERYILEKDTTPSINRLNKLLSYFSEDTNNKVIANYKGGPESSFGVGRTKVLAITRRSMDQNLVGLKSMKGFTSIPLNTLLEITELRTLETGSLAYLNVLIKDPKDYFNFTSSIKFSDKYDYRNFKNTVNGKQPGYVPIAASNYAKYNLETRIGVARDRGNDRSNYATGSNTYDKVNALSLIQGPGQPKTLADSNKVFDYNGNPLVYTPTNRKDEVAARDMVKFRIKSINNDKPTEGVFIIFRSYITSIKRTVNAKWDPYNYVGRGESFYLYDGHTEAISVAFTIAASSRYEMRPLYQKLNYLISTFAPDYKNGKMRGNLSELTIGDFLLYQPGIITSLDMTIDEDTNWEIAIDEVEKGEDVDMKELPHMIKCSMNFIPIYNFLPRKAENAPFIGIDGKDGGVNWLNNDGKYRPKIEESKK